MNPLWIRHCQPIPDLVIESDASNGGWGACYNGLRTRGQWSRHEAPLHINGKELLATFLAVQPFAKNKRVWHIRLKVDNMTAVGTKPNKVYNITNQNRSDMVIFLPAAPHTILTSLQVLQTLARS